MKLSYIIVFLLVICWSVMTGQQVQVSDSLLFTKKELPSAEFLRRDIYVPGTLWGYIDGGADIYFEYGFEKAVVEDIKLNGMTFKSEIYQMTDAASAYGIFSISKSRCRERDSTEDHSCITNYQVQFAKDKYYISVINETGSAEAKNSSKELAKKILKKLPQNNFRLPDLFYTSKLSPYKENARLIQGQLGIQNTLPELEDKFQALSNYDLYYLPVETEHGNLNLYYTSIKDPGELEKFASEIKTSVNTEKKERNTRWRFYKVNESTILFTESDLSTDIYDSYINNFNLPGN